VADIKTILRELSVILGYILAKYKLTFTEDNLDIKTYLDFIRKYCKNVNECNSEIQKIEEIEDFVVHKGIIKNGLNLGKLLYEKLNLDGDIYWLGSSVNSKYPYDIKIGDTGISLKEDSYILKNPSFANYLNALVQPDQPFKNVHVFRKFAGAEFNNWYNYTYKKLFAEYKTNSQGSTIFSYPKRGTFITIGTTGLIFGNSETIVEIEANEDLDEISLNARLGGYIFEHTVSKWIKETLEKKDVNYEKLKKECSLKAGENLKDFVINNLNLNNNQLLELFQIYDEPYYYGKSFGKTHLYQVPSNKECKISLKDIEIKVPQSQLNVYFTFEISNSNGSNVVIFRVECRYSHGQLKGIPEAKLYYTDNVNHLQDLYKVIT
jgi:frataxin-like iron-binding protein CyaY